MIIHDCTSEGSLHDKENTKMRAALPARAQARVAAADAEADTACSGWSTAAHAQAVTF